MKGEPSWQERKVGSKYPPEGAEAGQTLGRSQLMRKEAFNSPYQPPPAPPFFFFLMKRKRLGTKFYLCPSGLNVQIVCLVQFSIFQPWTFWSPWSRADFVSVSEVGKRWHRIRKLISRGTSVTKPRRDPEGKPVGTSSVQL